VRRQALAGLCGLVFVGVVVGAWQAAEVGYVASPVGPPEDLAELADLSQVELLDPGVAQAPGDDGAVVLGATEGPAAPVVLVLGGHDGLVLGAGLRSAGALDVVIGASEDCVLPDACSAAGTWPGLVDRFAPDLVLLHVGASETIEGLAGLAASLTAGGAELVLVAPSGAATASGIDVVAPAAVVDRIAALLAAHAIP
jgi:hypothetical protein